MQRITATKICGKKRLLTTITTKRKLGLILVLTITMSSSEKALNDDGSSPSSSLVNLLDLGAAALASTVSASLIIQDKCRGVSTCSMSSVMTDCELPLGSAASSLMIGELPLGSAASSSMVDGKNARLKEDGSFVTDADFAAQGIIMDYLRHVSDKVTIMGEESMEEMAQHIGKNEPLLDREKIYNLARQELYQRFIVSRSSPSSPSSPSSSLSASVHHHQQHLPLATTKSPVATNEYYQQQEEEGTMRLPTLPLERRDEYLVEPSRVAVFVDPLDGTKAYAHGQYESVSVLIGIMLDHKPVFGVICKPFGGDGLSSILHMDCAAVYGGTLLNDAYVAGSQSCRNGIGAAAVKESTSTDDDDGDDDPSSSSSSSFLYRAVISSSKNKGIVVDFCAHLGTLGLIHPKPLLVSGAGVKSLSLILRKRNEGLWFYPKAGTYLWDVAASDALLRTLGGKLTNKFGEELDYSKPRSEAKNVNGIVACIDSRLHADCIRIFHEKKWEDS